MYYSLLYFIYSKTWICSFEETQVNETLKAFWKDLEWMSALDLNNLETLSHNQIRWVLSWSFNQFEGHSKDSVLLWEYLGSARLYQWKWDSCPRGKHWAKKETQNFYKLNFFLKKAICRRARYIMFLT